MPPDIAKAHGRHTLEHPNKLEGAQIRRCHSPGGPNLLSLSPSETGPTAD